MISCLNLNLTQNNLTEINLSYIVLNESYLFYQSLTRIYIFKNVFTNANYIDIV